MHSSLCAALDVSVFIGHQPLLMARAELRLL